MAFNTSVRQQNPAVQRVNQQNPVAQKATSSICNFKDSHGMEVSFSFEDIQKYLCKGITGPEFAVLANICRSLHLNPFAREVFFIKFDGSPAQYIVAKEAFEKAAEANPQYDGKEAGVVVKNAKGEIEYRTGAIYIPGEETLIGGWCSVYRKDRSHPDRAEVSFNEYNKGKSTWKQIPATMIQKVAIAQALRAAFPSGLGGLYTTDELEAPQTNELPIQQEPHQQVIEQGRPDPQQTYTEIDPSDLI